jgi:heme-degrading monooxygenase HmoA
MDSRLPLRGYRFIPRFLAHSMRIRRQLATADGLIGFALTARLAHKEFWTVSVWDSRDELERFASADPHATITRTKSERMQTSKFVFWTARGATSPSGGVS